MQALIMDQCSRTEPAAV